MIKKITIGIVVFMVMSVSVYSQDTETMTFTLVRQDVSRKTFIEIASPTGSKMVRFDGYSTGSEMIADGYSRVVSLPNSVANEISRQLTDYRPLINGQLFWWFGNLPFSLSLSSGIGQVYVVWLRVVDATRWEHFFCIKPVVF